MARWMAAALLLAALALAAQCGPEAQLRWLAVQLYLNHTGLHAAVPCDRVDELVAPAAGPAPSFGPLGSFRDAAGFAAALREARERALARVGAFVEAAVRIYMAKAAALVDAGMPEGAEEAARGLEDLARLLRALNLTAPALRPAVDAASCLRGVGNLTAQPPAGGDPEEALQAVERLMDRLRGLWDCFERAKVAAPRLLQERLAALNATRAALVGAPGRPQPTRGVPEANR